MALANLSIYYTLKNIKSSYNKSEISAATWNDDGSYSISDIQDYFEYIIKKHETNNQKTYSNNPPVQIHVNKIKNWMVFKMKTD